MLCPGCIGHRGSLFSGSEYKTSTCRLGGSATNVVISQIQVSEVDWSRLRAGHKYSYEVGYKYPGPSMRYSRRMLDTSMSTFLRAITCPSWEGPMSVLTFVWRTVVWRLLTLASKPLILAALSIPMHFTRSKGPWGQAGLRLQVKALQG